MLMPAIRATLALPLLMARVLADHQDRPVSADYLALLAHRLYGSSNLHCSGSRLDNRIPARPMNRTAERTNRPQRPTKKDSRDGPLGTAGQASCQGVRMRGPPGVTATVNSKWAAREPSSE